MPRKKKPVVEKPVEVPNEGHGIVVYHLTETNVRDLGTQVCLGFTMVEPGVYHKNHKGKDVTLQLSGPSGYTVTIGKQTPVIVSSLAEVHRILH